MYRYDLNFDRRNCQITQYIPIRLMISQYGFCNMALIRLKYFYNKNNPKDRFTHDSMYDALCTISVQNFNF